MVVPATVDVSFMSPGVAPLAVTTSESGGNTFVTVDVAEICGDLGDIANAHAVIASDGTIYVGGCCGLQPAADGGPSIAPGGPGPETSRCMQLLEVFLRACGAGVEHITMVHVYLIDNTTARFGEMNAAYLSFFGDRPKPARITTGTSDLVLGACVEIDLVAKMPTDTSAKL